MMRIDELITLVAATDTTLLHDTIDTGHGRRIALFAESSSMGGTEWLVHSKVTSDGRSRQAR
jgi:hypothetical protein